MRRFRFHLDPFVDKTSTLITAPPILEQTSNYSLIEAEAECTQTTSSVQVPPVPDQPSTSNPSFIEAEA